MIELLVTEEIKDKLAENPARANAIINSTNEVGICITNQQMEFVAVNDEYCRLYGYERHELIGNKFTMIVPEEYKEQMQHLHDKFMRDKREVARDWTVATKNGPLDISVDTAFSDKIFGGEPHKITLVIKAD